MLRFTTACFALFGLCASAEERVAIEGYKGYTPLRIKNLAPGTTIDMTGGDFVVAISRNANPTEDTDCKVGEDEVNRYPVAVIDSPLVTISGGRFAGLSPLESDWVWTYCNSAALRVETSISPRIENVRIDRAWDAIRIDEESEDFEIDRVWVTKNRDDCIENDHLADGTIRDSLFDGCFAGFSVAPRDVSERRASLDLDGVLIRMETYIYKERVRHALPFKIEDWNLKLSIANSVIAIESDDIIGGKRTEMMWQSIDQCSGNLLLWLGEGPVPEELAARPQCFDLIEGEEALRQWEEARLNWINCHPTIARLEDDPVPEPENCIRTELGGRLAD